MGKRKSSSRTGRKSVGKEANAAPVKKKAARRPIAQYEHGDQERVNNPPVGLVTTSTDPPEAPKKTYAYDPHLDPQLVWAGKAERTSFEVPTVSLHVHERIDPKTIIEAVKSSGTGDGKQRMIQQSLFDQPRENPPLRDAIDFYQHAHGWSNRLIAGDSLLVMNSLLEKEGMAGKVQMIFIDPPYGIRYGSNFQPFVNNRDVKDGKDSDLTQEPEMIRAFRDTWELGIHSYLTYIRDRLALAIELLGDSGSCFVQIGDENVHLARNLLDEVFGAENCISLIAFRKTAGATSQFLPATADYLLWYAKRRGAMKYRPLYLPKGFAEGGSGAYDQIELADGTRRRLLDKERQEIAGGSIQIGRAYRHQILTSPRVREARSGYFPVQFEGTSFLPTTGEWKTHSDGIARLIAARRVSRTGATLSYVRYLEDFPAFPLSNVWDDTQSGSAMNKVYVVQTNAKVIERAMLMTTDPGDLVVDPTCGSGTTAAVAEQWGRRWITCDTSRVAITLAKQRLMTADFDYYELARPDEGIPSGFCYKSVPHVTLKSIANNPDIREGMTRAEIDAAIARYAEQETLYDQPFVDKTKVRVTGPFTVEAVPAPTVLPIDQVPQAPAGDASVARSGVTLAQDEWRDEMAKTGVRAHGGKRIELARLEPLAGARWLHAVGDTRNGSAKRIAVSFGPEYAPLEQRQVELAWEEARGLSPRPEILLFAAFQFDPEAAKDVDELDPKKTGMTFLRAQMNTDLLTEDLKKKRASNESFWLIGQPDVELARVKSGADKGKWQVEVRGFDYYNPVSGQIESGDNRKIAMWLLDTDYDGRSIYPRQVFFPMAGPKDGWARLARSLKAEIDEDKIEAYRGTESLPFEAGKHKRVAVKIVDDRGIESLKLLELS